MPLHGVLGKTARRLGGAVIGAQSVAVALGALVAWALARSDGGAATADLVGGLVLAFLCVLVAGSMRRPWGITLGWIVELACVLSGFVVPMMVIVGLAFGALWAVALTQGSKVDRMMAEHEAAAERSAESR